MRARLIGRIDGMGRVKRTVAVVTGLLTACFISSSTHVRAELSEKQIAQYGGIDNILLASTNGEIVKVAPLCKLRTVEWAERLKDKVVEKFKADSNLTSKQRFFLFMLIASAGDEGEDDYRANNEEECNDIAKKLPKADALVGGSQ